LCCGSGGDTDPSVVLGLGLGCWAAEDLDNRRSMEKAPEEWDGLVACGLVRSPNEEGCGRPG